MVRQKIPRALLEFDGWDEQGTSLILQILY